MVSNRSFDRLNLTHKRTSCVSLLLFLFFKEIVRWLSNIVWTSYQSLLIVFCTLNLMRTEVLIEKNLIFSFDSISTLCSFQCSRSTWRGTLLYYQTRTHLSTTFFKFFNFCFRVWHRRFRQLLYITKWYTYCQLLILSIFINNFIPDQNNDHLIKIKNRQRPTFPGSFPPSIISAKELNYCVRDGNRCDLLAIVTGFSYEGSHPQNWTM